MAGYGEYTPEAYGKAYGEQQRKAYKGTKGRQNLGVSNKEYQAYGQPKQTISFGGGGGGACAGSGGGGGGKLYVLSQRSCCHQSKVLGRSHTT